MTGLPEWLTHNRTASQVGVFLPRSPLSNRQRFAADAIARGWSRMTQGDADTYERHGIYVRALWLQDTDMARAFLSDIYGTVGVARTVEHARTWLS